MTGRGSVTPGMACGSRPVESSPPRGAFPTVGINPRPGVKGAKGPAPLTPGLGFMPTVGKAPRGGLLSTGREPHAIPGVWLPAGGEQPAARGFPDSRHKPKARGQGGRAFRPLDPWPWVYADCRESPSRRAALHRPGASRQGWRVAPGRWRAARREGLSRQSA